ncbi:NAD-binding protein [Anoxynatronum buryatiense]|uniref:TrkA-N domain-containing protein n=1 Tax=Anoxynatronum buryatiense TaxID=489973 RepID=A0AA46AJ14_9CLOT|nr:NAD-binding protein [Anoxynatronum buryatiense]SMP55184.1 TrkA-N domain-containing protein [Anoxynatronum buryatiense]
MRFLLGLTTVGFILLGYRVMQQLDGFFDRQGFDLDLKVPLVSMALIYWENQPVTRFESMLQQEKIPYRIVTEPQIPEDVKPIAVLALSENDLNNLLLCTTAKHQFPAVLTVARCNDSLYRHLFQQGGVDTVLEESLPAEDLLHHVMIP